MVAVASASLTLVTLIEWSAYPPGRLDPMAQYQDVVSGAGSDNELRSGAGSVASSSTSSVCGRWSSRNDAIRSAATAPMIGNRPQRDHGGSPDPAMTSTGSGRLSASSPRPESSSVRSNVSSPVRGCSDLCGAAVRVATMSPRRRSTN